MVWGEEGKNKILGMELLWGEQNNTMSIEKKSRMKVWIININTYCLFVVICFDINYTSIFPCTQLLRGERRVNTNKGQV